MVLCERIECRFEMSISVTDYILIPPPPLAHWVSSPLSEGRFSSESVTADLAHAQPSQGSHCTSLDARRPSSEVATSNFKRRLALLQSINSCRGYLTTPLPQSAHLLRARKRDTSRSTTSSIAAQLPAIRRRGSGERSQAPARYSLCSASGCYCRLRSSRQQRPIISRIRHLPRHSRPTRRPHRHRQ